MKFPPFLKPGDEIGLVCPAGYMSKEKVNSCVSVLKKWGYKVAVGKTVGGKSKNYFSGTDNERLADIQQFLDDPKIKAIVCARGGYGTTRILDQIDWSIFKKNPKWIVGFSDITVLHGYLQKTLKTSSIHGPMAGAFNKSDGEDSFIQSLKKTLEGKEQIIQSQHHPFNHLGKTSAPITGGNLCLLAHGIGSNSEIDTKNKILFIEDIDEQLYNIDRMMHQLKRAGKLRSLKALLVGGFSDCKDTERPFGKKAYEIIQECVQEYEYPKVFGFPISHEKENMAIVLGKTYSLHVTKTGATLGG